MRRAFRVSVLGTLAAALSLSLACGEVESKNSRRGDLQFLLSEEQGPVRQGDLDFGEVPSGTPARRNFKIVNAGSDRALITAVKFEDAAPGTFFVQAPDSVNAGEERAMSVTFAPSQPGTYTARLVIEHDGYTLSAALNLTGVAR